MTAISFVLLLMAALGGYLLNRRAALALRDGGVAVHSLAGFHGFYALLVVLLPALLVFFLWAAFSGGVIGAMVAASLPPEATAGLDNGAIQLIEAEIRSLARGQAFGEGEPWKTEAAAYMNRLQALSGWILLGSIACLCAVTMTLARRRVAAGFRARQASEAIVHRLLIGCSLVAIVTTVGIISSLVFESARFFSMVPFHEFLFGLNWEPQIPIRADQVAGAGAFGWIPVLTGTLVITVIALAIAVPIGLASAIYLNEFATPRLRKIAKPMLEILAGIPTVVYGFFAILTVAPALRSGAAQIGLEISPNTALAAGGVMAMMLIPFISSFTDDALSAVPRSLRDGSLALGATRAETVLKVMVPAAIPGIVGGVLLAVSRAIGETMIVVMAAGLIASLTINPLDSVTTVTVQIVTLLIGDTSFDSPKTLAAFALGLMLFLVTLGINVLALKIVRKYREIYD